MIKTVIIAGGNYPDYYIFYKSCEEADYIIAADSGYDYLVEYGIEANYLIGDFDSIKHNLDFVDNSIITKYPVEKNATDLQIAVEKSISLKSNEVIIFGGTGTRLDHTLANIFLLKKYYDLNIKCKMVDNNNEIRLLKGVHKIKKGDYKYFSIIPFKNELYISLQGVKYNLNNKIVPFPDTLCLSNEINGEECTISLSDYAIVIQSKD